MKWLLLLFIVAVCVNAKCEQVPAVVDDDDNFQGTLDAAFPGMVILLETRSYSGPFYLRKSGEPDCPIVITSRRASLSTIRTEDNMAGLRLENYSSNVYIHDLIFKASEASSGAGLVFEDAENVTVESCTFDSSSLFLMGSSQNTIKSCDFSNSFPKAKYDSVIGFSGEECENTRNLFTECTFGDGLTTPAFYLGKDACSNNITFCKFTGAHGSEEDYIEMTGSYNLVFGNKFYNPDNMDLKQAIFADGDSNVIQKNSFDLNKDDIYAVTASYFETVCASNQAIDCAGVSKNTLDPSC